MNKCSRDVIDRERTKHDVWGLLSFFQGYMVDSSTGVVLSPSVGVATSSTVGCWGRGLVAAIVGLAGVWASVGKVSLVSTVVACTVIGVDCVGVVPSSLG